MINCALQDSSPRPEIIFLAQNTADQKLVEFVERQTGLCAIEKLPESQLESLRLQADRDGISLVKGPCCLRADFSHMLPRLIPNNLNHELLIRASKCKTNSGNLTAVDATAGLGEDSFLLAAAGFKVQLYERDPIIAVLLYDALRRGMQNAQLEPIIQNMDLQIADSVLMLPQLDISPDIVVLDPMFPRRQKSGLIKKKFQLLHQLEQPCQNEQELLDAARSCHPRKIVIKRPAKGPYLNGIKPSYSIQGNSIRYDCLVNFT